MAFCPKGFAAIKKLWRKVTPELQQIINDVIDFTSKLKALQANPAVQLIESLIPGNQVFVTAINTALDALSTGENIMNEQATTAQKLTDFINEIKRLSPKSANAKLMKLASLLVTQLHSLQNDGLLSEVEADSLVQLQMLVNKAQAVQS
jgi:hypothetical protein